MTRRDGDLRFVLPHVVETAVVIGRYREARVAALARGLDDAEVRVRGPGGAPTAGLPDVVVAMGADAAEALETPGRAHLLLGRVPRAMRSSIRGSLPLLVRTAVTAPELVLPLSPAEPLVHHLRRLSAPRSRLRRGRNLGAAALGRLPFVAPGLAPPHSLVTLVPTPGSAHGPPAILQAAASLGMRPGNAWLLSLGRGDELQRAVFHVLDGAEPAWVVKFSRVPGYHSAFVRDATGLALARDAGGLVAAHAPRHLGRLEVGGLTASVETAARGGQLLPLLRTLPMALLDAIAGWVAGVGQETAHPASALDGELVRLRHLVAAEGSRLSLPPDLLDRLPPVPAVLQHNDLGSWNIVSDGRTFTVVDWESARRSGLPLWDLFYFAADVLPRLEGPADVDTLVRRTLQVFAGQSTHSARLHGWLRDAADRVGVPVNALGALATLCWLHHGQSAAGRASDLHGAAPAPLGHLARLAPAWLAHPGLGVAWHSMPG